MQLCQLPNILLGSLGMRGTLLAVVLTNSNCIVSFSFLDKDFG